VIGESIVRAIAETADEGEIASASIDGGDIGAWNFGLSGRGFGDGIASNTI